MLFVDFFAVINVNSSGYVVEVRGISAQENN